MRAVALDLLIRGYGAEHNFGEFAFIEGAIGDSARDEVSNGQ